MWLAMDEKMAHIVSKYLHGIKTKVSKWLAHAIAMGCHGYLVRLDQIEDHCYTII